VVAVSITVNSCSRPTSTDLIVFQMAFCVIAVLRDPVLEQPWAA